MLIGCPSVLQFDCGNEHVSIASTQYAMRENDDDSFAGDKSFRFGKSTSNTVRNLAYISCMHILLY